MKHIKEKSASRKGDLAEYYAVTWLWDNGYEVFQNSGCTGPIDMIAMDKKGNTILIDVKTVHVYSDSKQHCKKTLTKTQQKLGVKLLGFNPETRNLQFIEHKDEK